MLVIGSGNLVHNLRMLDWSGQNKIYDWAQEFDMKFKNWIDSGNHTALVNYKTELGNTAVMAHPSNEHLLPLFYILGLQHKGEQVKYFNEQMDMGAISMRSMIIS